MEARFFSVPGMLSKEGGEVGHMATYKGRSRKEYPNIGIFVLQSINEITGHNL